MSKENRKTKGTADVVDKHVSTQIRNRRILMGLSQERLADAVGVTFQQIQKYERGTNRVSASRLWGFSKILGVSVDYFYKNLDKDSDGMPAYGMADNDQDGFQGISDATKSIPENILESKEVLDLLKAYYSVSDPKKRKEIIRFIKSMS